ncbi:aspartate ammonia-lyase [Roseiarcus fermentans]|uniref:Aspartate ammonia-lyase n=1 Tax=Roseiarcus fermentans TaxID=1473586 RepID=A0A366EEV9_9HYPH|nr:aspartate ammonia-lyase [Roseiarcus fermentans]RBP00863.1 aspartate ammonia-lyase [Roseiarcus fermentans]
MSEQCAFRVEHDLIGDLRVAAEAYYGVHTARALENFAVLGRPCHPELIKAMAAVKEAAALTNRSLSALDAEAATAICEAAREVSGGLLHEWIRVDGLQGGAGTSLNMNVNEVIANRAAERLGFRKGDYARIHPIDHVNLHQSTNDVFPTALRVAALRLLDRLEARIAGLQLELQDKEAAFSGLLKMGRTQLQDALPTTFGATFGAWAEAIARDRWRVFKCKERLRVVNLGATAIGTGVAAPRDYIFRVVGALRDVTKLNLSRAENLLDATQNVDVFVEVSGILKAHAVNLFKISSDIRLMASGPRAGLNELALAPVQAGSSIMPGKVNPVICEAVAQAAMAMIGHDAAITAACQSGQLELNAFLPLVAQSLLDGLTSLIAADAAFAERCIARIGVNAAEAARQVETSWAVVTALVPALGYEEATRIAAAARGTGRAVRELARETGLIDDAELDRLLSPATMTHLGAAPRPFSERR